MGYPPFSVIIILTYGEIPERVPEMAYLQSAIYVLYPNSSLNPILYYRKISEGETSSEGRDQTTILFF